MSSKWRLLLCALLVAGAQPSEDCTQKSACECEFDDGTHIDLSDLFHGGRNDGTTFLYDTKDNTTIYYHGCVDVPFQVDITNITLDHCRAAASICVFDSGNRSFETLGQSTGGKFALNAEGIHTLSYESGNKSTTVLLVCTPEYDENNIDFHDVSKDGMHYKLQLFSKHACRNSLPPALSTGTKLLIIFVTFAFVYFVAGALLAFFIRGARGCELIPNVDFWRSLPGLVKDGIVFILGGCNPRVIPTAETYDQI